jgi:hypothetical protein
VRRRVRHAVDNDARRVRRWRLREPFRDTSAPLRHTGATTLAGEACHLLEAGRSGAQCIHASLGAVRIAADRYSEANESKQSNVEKHESDEQLNDREPFSRTGRSRPLAFFALDSRAPLPRRGPYLARIHAAKLLLAAVTESPFDCVPNSFLAKKRRRR